MIEGWITRRVTAAHVLKVEPSDSAMDGRFALEVEFTAPVYAQLMQRLLIFKPAIVSRRESLFLTESSRKFPVVLQSSAYAEKVHVTLPAGFEVDEVPDGLNLDTSFGTYAAKYEVQEGRLLFTRNLVLRAATIPVDEYNTVRSFFERIRATEQSPVVLARK